MKKFLALLKVCLPSVLLTLTGKSRGQRKRAATGLGAALLIAGLALYISGVYSFLLMETLAPVGMERLVFLFMGLAALFSGMIFTAFGSSGTVFGAKDNDLMLSMPVSTTILMAARVTAIYLENLLFSFFMLAPAGVAYAMLSPVGAGRTVGFWLRLASAALALPLLDTALAVVIGAGIVWLSAKMPRKTLGKNLLMGAWIALVFWLSFSLSSGVEMLAVNAASIEASLGWAAPVVWMTQGIMGDELRLLAFVGVCVAAFALMVAGLGHVYRRMTSAFASTSARSDYRLSNQQSSGLIRALFHKEARRFFGTPVYLWNCGLGLMMLVVLGVAALVKRADLAMYLAMPEFAGMALPAVCAVMAFMISLSAICAPSFSLEGKQLWILRTAPLNEKTLILVKVGFQLLLAVPCIALAVVCLAMALSLTAAEIAMLCLFCAALEGMHALMGGWAGLALARPEMDETAVLKRSMLSFVSMFGPMAIVGCAAALAWWIGSGWGMTVVVGIVTAVLAMAAIVFGALLRIKGPEMVRKMG